MLLEQAARGGRRWVEGEVSLSDVARLATGSRVNAAGPNGFADFVAGRSVGILGPAPLSEVDRAEVLAADIVAAPVAPTADADRLNVHGYVDIAYVLPWSGELHVDWRSDGVLVVRGSDGDGLLTGFDGKFRHCRSVRASGLVGHPTAVPDMVVDLLVAGAAEVRVAGVNFYMSTLPPYRSSASRFGLDEWNSVGRPFFATSMFATHPPIENRNLVRTLALSGRVKLLGETADVIEMPSHRAAELLESSWSMPRR